MPSPACPACPACPTSLLLSSTSSPARRSKLHRLRPRLPRLPRLPRIRMSWAVVGALASLSCVSLAQQDALPSWMAPSASLGSPSSALDCPVAPTPAWDAPTDDEPPLLDARDAPTDASKTVPTPTTLVMPRRRAVATAESNQSPLPSPLDNAKPSDFRASDSSGDKCPNFMSKLLGDAAFKSCYPVSMMVQTSRGFFEAQEQLVGIVGVLDAACKADVSSCSNFFDKAAKDLLSTANCKAEADSNHTLVLQAWRGLRAYKTLFGATCLQDPSTSSYCFASAVTNMTNPSDAYIYSSLPYGLPLPATSMPTCSWCTQQTMKLFQSASANRDDFVARNYEDAARQINTVCGPGFANMTLPRAEAGKGAAVVPPSVAVLATACAAVLALVSGL